MLLKVAGSLADLWLTRGRRLDAQGVAARSAVSKFAPAVVVTGSSRGIGAAIAAEFAAHEAIVAIVARDLSGLQAAERRIITATNGRTISIACDVALPNAPQIISERLAAAGLYLDVLVNNAGVGLTGPFASHVQDDIDALLALNVSAVMRLTRAALPGMLARRRGGILNVASLGAYAPGPHQAAYYASKAYVLSLTEALAVENAGSGVRFCVLAPGPVETSFHADMGADAALYRQIMPALTPKRVARAAYRGFIIGQRVVIPGLINRAALAILKLAPHPISAPIVGRLLRRPES